MDIDIVDSNTRSEDDLNENEENLQEQISIEENQGQYFILYLFRLYINYFNRS